MLKGKGSFWFIVIVLFLFFTFFSRFISFYTDLLWFKEVGLSSVFFTIIFSKIGLGLSLGVLLGIIFCLNIWISSRQQSPEGWWEEDGGPLNLPPKGMIEPLVKRLLFPSAILVGLFAGLLVSNKWDHLIRYMNVQPFGILDPLFGKDLGFYIFKLPFLEFLYSSLSTILWVSLLTSAFIYLLFRGIWFTPKGVRFSRLAKYHLSSLGAAILFLKAFGYRLEMYNLLFSPRGVAFGASFTDVNVSLPILKILFVMAILCGVLFLIHIFLRSWKPIAIGVGAVILFRILGGAVYPAIVQKFLVVPNEISKERPFIQLNIKHTRSAYGLDKIEEKDFPSADNLTSNDILKNDPTIKNIRLWDKGPLLSSYAQLQEIRTYYNFNDVDNDRYIIDGEYRQVMLSPREISYKNLPSRIWINEHLTYTHGYGIVAGPVSRISKEGLPEFMIKDIPPVSSVDLKVTRPEIYFGEIPNDYVIVQTKSSELDYPLGNKNVYSTYKGKGGVPLSSLWRKILFAIRFGTVKILLSTDLTKESRIMYYRAITERVARAAPFLKYDSDPYLVLSSEGRLFWFVDAYTTTDRYPYSEPVKNMGNYIKNSVKVLVDAYNGSLAFYIADSEDPIIATYSKAFPGLFKPLQEMPQDLKAHIRYPQDLFSIQAKMFATYHMRDSQVFYNKEDIWSIPKGSVNEKEAEIEPYYNIIKLPEEEREEFILIIPFTPSNKDNMSAWLAARSDPPNYGKLIAYNFPKAKLIYGPRQIEARIDQNAEISEMITLWSQRGSKVIRGSLLVIPIEKSLLYVQPLYLSAERGQLPELRRVIVSYSDQVVMEETLESSLARIFGGRTIAPGIKEKPLEISRGPKEKGALSLSKEAIQYYNKALEMLRQGNWAGFGEELKRLGETLKKGEEIEKKAR